MVTGRKLVTWIRSDGLHGLMTATTGKRRNASQAQSSYRGLLGIEKLAWSYVIQRGRLGPVVESLADVFLALILHLNYRSMRKPAQRNVALLPGIFLSQVRLSGT